mgnify:CR=1 FL=1
MAGAVDAGVAVISHTALRSEERITSVRAGRYASMQPLQRKVSDYLRENVYVTTSGMAWEPAISFCLKERLPGRQVAPSPTAKQGRWRLDCYME